MPTLWKYKCNIKWIMTWKVTLELWWFSDFLELRSYENYLSFIFSSNVREGKQCQPISYTCIYCNKDFFRKRDMKMHIVFKHTEVYSIICRIYIVDPYVDPYLYFCCIFILYIIYNLYIYIIYPSIYAFMKHKSI